MAKAKPKRKTIDWQNRIVEHGEMPADQFLAHELNARRHPGQQREALRGSLNAVGWIAPVIVSKRTGKLLDGHARIEEALSRDESALVPFVLVDVTEAEEAIILGTFDPITGMATYDREALDTLLREIETNDAGLQNLLEDLAAKNDLYLTDEKGAGGEPQDAISSAPIQPEEARKTLADRFLVPPFSVLDARQGYWQDRKRAWLALGIQSELGRGDTSSTKESKTNKLAPGGTGKNSAWIGQRNATTEAKYAKGASGLARCFGQDLMRGEHVVGETASLKNGLTHGTTIHPYDGSSSEVQSGTSIFDPVLCEIAYRWFSPPDGAILDPFAGGSVRGIVASILGRNYTGIDLRGEQIAANETQAKQITPERLPRWITGDSRDAATLAAGEYDLVFSCPPYADLEVYSDNPQDLSTMKYEDFLTAYREIIAQAVGMLKPNRFACFVVGDVRDKKGFYLNFVSDTISAFQGAGAKLYNEAILVTSVGSLPIRVGRQFEAGRKLGKTHQNVLVFLKGDPKKAVADCGTVEVHDPAENFGEVV